MSKTKTPTSIADYVKSLAEVKEVLSFIRTEVMNVKSKRHLTRMVVFGFFVILFQAFVPVALGKIISGVAVKSVKVFVVGIVSTTFCMVVQKLCERQMQKAREWIIGIHWRNMDKRMTELFLEKSPGQHIQEPSLAVSGIDKGRWNMISMQSFIFFDAIPTVNQIAISLVLIAYKSFAGGGLMTLAVCLYVGYSLYLNFHTMRVMRPVDRSMRRLNKRRAERMEKAIRVIVSSQVKREVEEMTEWFDRDLKKDIGFWIWFIEKSTWRSLINVLLFIAVIGYGSRLAWIGVWEVGILVPLFMWSLRIIENIWQLGAIEQKINWTMPSVKHMIKALSIKPDIVDVPNAIRLCPSTPQRIILDAVFHSYPSEVQEGTRYEDEDDPDYDIESISEEEAPHTLKKVGFTIEPGEKVALLGPSGAGKTTLMYLLMRFMDPTAGSISVGGNDLRHIAKDSWRKCFGWISQNPQVFDGTVKENLTYGLSALQREQISDEELWRLMRRLEIDFGKRLNKNGLETKVGKHGLKLSGGQAQRLMIGAAVIGKPWFMIIDEATSSLDSTTELKVQEGLAEILSGGASALIIAHRFSTVRHLCTKFVVLKPADKVVNGDSQVEAIGRSFEELYQISPTFRQLADDQGIQISPRTQAV